jgi:ribosomal protein L37AE/L43A
MLDEGLLTATFVHGPAMPIERVRPLVVIRTPFPDESLLSLLVRAAEANAFRSFKYILPFAGLEPSRHLFVAFTQAQYTDALSQLLSLPRAEIAGRMHPHVDNAPTQDYVDCFGVALPRRWIDTKSRRVSPNGLRISPYHRFGWMIRPLSFCAETMEYLILNCPHCGKEQRWEGASSVWRCGNCSKSLRHHRPGKVAGNLQKELEAVVAFISHDSKVRAQALSELPTPFSEWSAGDVFVAIIDLAIVVACSDRYVDNKTRADWHKGNFSFATPENLVRAFRVLHSWRDGFAGLVKAIANCAANRCGGLSTKELLGPLNKYLRDDGGKDTPLRHLILETLPEIIRDEGLPLRGRYSEVGKFVTSTQVEKQLGLPRGTTVRLNEKSKSLIVNARTMKLYDRESVKRTIAIWHQSVRPPRVARALGVPSHTLPAFASQGLLSWVTESDALLLNGSDQLYCSVSLETLIQKVNSLPCVPLDGDIGISIFTALESRRAEPDVWAGIFGAIIAGHITVVGIDARATGLSQRALVSAPALMAFVSSIPHREIAEVEISGAMAADVLQCSDSHISDAFRVGLLAGRNKGQKKFITLSSLMAFDRDYVFTGELERRGGRDAALLYHRFNRIGIRPAASLSKTKVWRRDEVTQLPEYRGLVGIA